MSVKKIYIVMGTLGQYSDRVEWPVGAYLHKIKAKRNISHLSDQMAELQQQLLSSPWAKTTCPPYYDSWVLEKFIEIDSGIKSLEEMPSYFTEPPKYWISESILIE